MQRCIKMSIKSLKSVSATFLSVLCISAFCRTWHTNMVYRTGIKRKNWRCYTLSFMCLAWHTNNSSKLLKKKSHIWVKSTVDLSICVASPAFWSCRGLRIWRKTLLFLFSHYRWRCWHIAVLPLRLQTSGQARGVFHRAFSFEMHPASGTDGFFNHFVHGLAGR